MSARIQQLPAELVNQIAAGEVVERPASVVKELVENAIDAAALSIRVAVEDGGKQLIRVVDDGSGIAPEELGLAVAAHATSKLQSADGLETIQTLGFRGEALASIGSVCELCITTRPHAAMQAAQIDVRYGVPGPVQPAAHAHGTSIEARFLFAQVPARRKFLKSARSEQAAVEEQVLRLALAYPHIRFSFTADGRLMHDLPPADSLHQRITQVLGADAAARMISIDRSADTMRIAGAIGRPIEARQTARWQHLYINGRFIRDRGISAAVKEAYSGLLDWNRQPPWILLLAVEPTAVDVNVHPAKTEVRFVQGQRVKAMVYHAVRDALLAADLVGQPAANALQRLDRSPAQAGSSGPAGQGLQDRAPAGRSGEADAAGRGVAGDGRWFPPLPEPRPGADGPAGPSPEQQAAMRRFAQQLTQELDAQAGQLLADGGLSNGLSRGADALAAAAPAAGLADVPASHPTHGATDQGGPADGLGGTSGRLIHAQPEAAAFVQILDTYLVTERDGALVLIDQHALHERILYQQLYERLMAAEALPSQRLLVPEPFEASAAQLAAAEEHAETLLKLGIELAPFGPRRLAIHSFPQILASLHAADAVSALLDRLASAGAGGSAESILHLVLDTMACKAAIKAGDRLSPEQMRSLLQQADRTQRSAHCPHGRPTMIRLTQAELERLFHRSR